MGEMPALSVAAPTESVRLISVPTDVPDPSPVRALPHWAVAVGFAGVVLAAVIMTTSRVFAPDSFLTLYAGRFISQHGIPTTDPFTVAAHGRTWIDQQWLAHWLFYGAWRIAGDAGVGMLSGMLIAAAFGMLAMTIMRRGVDPVRAVIWAMVAFFVCQPNTFIRSQSFAYPLFAALLWILVEDDRRERFRWPVLLAVPVLILWANLHGSALMGAGIGVAWALFRMILMRRRGDHRSSDRYLATAFGFAASAVVISPYSPHALGVYYRAVMENPNLAHYVTEWRPTTFSAENLAFLVMVAAVLVIVGYAAGRGVRPSLPLAALAVVTAAAGIHAIRYQVWFAFPAAVLLADLMEAVAPSAAQPMPAEGKARLRARMLGIAAAVMMLLGAVTAFGSGQSLRIQILCLFGGFIAGLVAFSVSGGAAWFRRLGMVIVAAFALAVGCSAVVLATTPQSNFDKGVPASTLRAANAYAVTHPGVKILADEITAPQLLWRYPDLNGRVGYDIRYEIYPSHVLTPFLHFIALDSPSWSAVTRDYQEIVASKAANPVLARRLRHLPGWRVLHSDADGIALVRG
jgi:hypothetical protein